MGSRTHLVSPAMAAAAAVTGHFTDSRRFSSRLAHMPTIFADSQLFAVPIDIPNCDTDQIIPARFLRRAKDDPAYARFLLHDLRFHADDTETSFIFNQAPYTNAQILVCDINWGCGSSREAAVNALMANHIRAVIAPTFGDIHYSNCIKNGLLPVRLSCCELQSHPDTVARISWCIHNHRPRQTDCLRP